MMRDNGLSRCFLNIVVSSTALIRLRLFLSPRISFCIIVSAASFHLVSCSGAVHHDSVFKPSVCCHKVYWTFHSSMLYAILIVLIIILYTTSVELCLVSCNSSHFCSAFIFSYFFPQNIQTSEAVCWSSWSSRCSCWFMACMLTFMVLATYLCAPEGALYWLSPRTPERVQSVDHEFFISCLLKYSQNQYYGGFSSTVCPSTLSIFNYCIVWVHGNICALHQKKYVCTQYCHWIYLNVKCSQRWWCLKKEACITKTKGGGSQTEVTKKK